MEVSTVKKMLKLRAIQMLQGDAAATEQILGALRKSKGNMRKACELLEIGKSSMYRLIEDLGCADQVDKLVGELDVKIQGKVLPTDSAKKPKSRTRKRAA